MRGRKASIYASIHGLAGFAWKPTASKISVMRPKTLRKVLTESFLTIVVVPDLL